MKVKGYMYPQMKKPVGILRYFNFVKSLESAIISIGLLCRCVAKETIYDNTDQLQDKTDERLKRN